MKEVAFEELAVDWRGKVTVLKMFIKRRLKQWTYYRFSFLMDMINMVVDLAIIFFIAQFFVGRPPPFLSAFNNDYISYAILAIVFNRFLASALSAPADGMAESFWSGRLEALMLSPVNPEWLIIGLSLWDFVHSLIFIALYLIVGIGMFGARVYNPNYGVAILVLVMAVVAVFGLGLMAASLFSLIEAKRGQDPLRWFVSTMVGLVSGVYYPLLSMPKALQILACFFPHTYVYDAARRALLGGLTIEKTLMIHRLLPLDPILIDMLMIVFFAAWTVPLGYYMFKLGIKKSRKDGNLSRWV